MKTKQSRVSPALNQRIPRETARQLDALTELWGLTISGALCRAIDQAARDAGLDLPGGRPARVGRPAEVPAEAEAAEVPAAV